MDGDSFQGPNIYSTNSVPIVAGDDYIRSGDRTVIIIDASDTALTITTHPYPKCLFQNELNVTDVSGVRVIQLYPGMSLN